jgi:hypothetical protein
LIISEGVVAKKDIKRNTLLVGSKAASISNEKDINKNTCLTLNSYTKTLQTPSQCRNFVNIISKAQNDPHLCREFYKLYSGPCLSREEPIDELLVDTSRIQAILTFNSFSNDSNFFELENDSEGKKAGPDREGGIWLFPSYFNHSCVPNTKRMFYSDFMMIYASNI